MQYDPYDAYAAYAKQDEQWVWFQTVVEGGKQMWSDPKVNIVTGEEYISFYNPVYIEDQLVAIAGVDLPFDYFNEMVKGIQLYETGGAFIINASNEIMVDEKNARGESLASIGYHELEEAINLQECKHLLMK